MLLAVHKDLIGLSRHARAMGSVSPIFWGLAATRLTRSDSRLRVEPVLIKLFGWRTGTMITTSVTSPKAAAREPSKARANHG